MATKEDRARWAREYRQRKKSGLRQPARGENLRKHGLTLCPEHRSWMSMMARCVWNSGPERDDYHIYKERGIKVCDRWKDFSKFFEDMGSKPTPKHTIDRYPNGDGNYEPGNCRWATPKEQARNWKHRNKLFTYGSESLTLSEWAERLGMARSSLRDRINSGMPLHIALTHPPVRYRQRTGRGTLDKSIVY